MVASLPATPLIMDANYFQSTAAELALLAQQASLKAYMVASNPTNLIAMATVTKYWGLFTRKYVSADVIYVHHGWL